VRWAVHDIWRGDFHAETHCGKPRCDHDDPEDFNGSKREHGDARLIFEDEADEEGTCLSDILRQQLKNKLHQPRR